MSVVAELEPRGEHLTVLHGATYETPAWFRKILRTYRRVAVAGGPKTGKTTLTHDCGRDVEHGDDYLGLGWSESSAALASEVNDYQGAVVAEGVQVPRALRKGMRVDCVVWLSCPHDHLTADQKRMAKGCQTVMREWLGDREVTPIEGVPGAMFIEVKA